MSTYNKRLIVLLDMDHVLADIEQYFLNIYREDFPNEPFVSLNERRVFKIYLDYERIHPDLGHKVMDVFSNKGFFENIPVMDGAIDAAKEMEKMENVDVFICTSPIDDYTYCQTEKMRWVEKHLGADWVRRVVITKDKTIVNGHILIDDNPEITGVTANPTWEHILFSAHHNLHIDAKQTRLGNWTDGSWRQIIEDRLEKL